MKILSILLLCSLLSLSKSDRTISDDAEENRSNHIPARKRLPIFPKINIKYVVNSHSNGTDTKNAETNGERDEIGTRKPLMVKLVPESKKPSLKTTDVVTRKPLMKVRTYTVKMASNGKDTKHREDRSQIKINSIKMAPTMRLENEQQVKVNTNIEINGDKIRLDRDSLFSDTGKFSKEENQDRREFIFLGKKNEDIVTNDLLYVSEENFETTTSSVIATKLRRKRSSNIIEEENMGTTVSPLRYTGRDTRLTNDLYYKNINH